MEMGISNELFPQDRPLPGEDSNGTRASVELPEPHRRLVTRKTRPTQRDRRKQRFSMTYRHLPTSCGSWLRRHRVGLCSMEVTVSRKLNQQRQRCVQCDRLRDLPQSPPGNTQVSNCHRALSNPPVPAFSDIEIHHMGTELADNVSQGGAGGDQFRTAPLWGLGQRIFLLHDGRTTDLLSAIEAHESNGSEATNVEANFDNLTPSQQQDVLNFLRSL